KKEAYGGSSYTSTRLRTKGKGDWLYGKFEIRAKMPIGQGIWPALWLMPTFEKYGGWAASGEVDMVEYLGHEPSKVYGTLHFGGQWPNNQQKGRAYTLTNGTFQQDFHLFSMEWEEGAFRWIVDGVLYQTQGKGDWWSSGGAFPAPFDDYFHLLMNLAVGGNWPGAPDASTQFPQELVIDYVRVYQRATADIDEKKQALPGKMGLLRNYPNPFNPTTLIDYQLNRAGDIEIALYNAGGECICTLVQAFQQSGLHAIRWDGRDDADEPAPAGVYFCQLRSDSQQDILKILLVK
ncbi:glycosyl hydrolase family protein, partial [candidate division KSB1 bacterium]